MLNPLHLRTLRSATIVAGVLACGLQPTASAADPTATPSDASAVIATVLDKPIAGSVMVAVSTEHQRKTMAPEEFADWQTYSRNKLLVTAIRTPLLEAYAKREGLEPTAADKRPYLEQMRSGMNSPNTPPIDAARKAAQERFLDEFATRTIREFKVGKALWQAHGGTVGFGSLGGCVPFEAQLAFLKEEVQAGRLVFHDAQVEQQFWSAIMDKRQLADVVVEEPSEIERYFALMLEGKSGE